MPVTDVDEELASYSALSNPSNGTVFNQSNLNYLLIIILMVMITLHILFQMGTQQL